MSVITYKHLKLCMNVQVARDTPLHKAGSAGDLYDGQQLVEEGAKITALDEVTFRT